MKKIISVLIVLAMVVSMLPAVFAEEAVQSVVKEYALGIEAPVTGTTTITLARSTASDGFYARTIGDKTYYLNAEYHQNYGTRGWRILDVNDEIIMKVAAYEGRVYRLFKDTTRNFIQLYVGYNGVSTGAYTGVEPDLGLALALQAPEKTAFYIPVMVFGNGFSGAEENYYIDRLSADKTKLADYVVEANKVTRSTSGRLSGAVYTKSGDEIVVAVDKENPGNKDFRFGKVTLTEIIDPTLSLGKTSYEFDLDDGNTENDSVKTSVTINGSIITTAGAAATAVSMNVSNNFITYTSSDENVVKVDADGTIKAVGKGNATISAKTEDGAYKTADIPVAVTGKFLGKDYMFDRSELKSENDVKLSDVTDYATHNGAVTNHDWKFFAYSDGVVESLTNPPGRIGRVGMSGNAKSLLFYLNEAGTNSAMTAAISLKAPEKASFYLPMISWYKNQKGAVLSWYMSYRDESITSVEAYAVDEARISYSNTGVGYVDYNDLAEKLIYTENGDEVMSTIVMSKGANFAIRYVSFMEVVNPTITAVVENASLDVSTAPSTKVSATVSGTTNEIATDRAFTNMPVVEGSVIYKSTNEAVAKVDASGTITAIGAGEAKIYAESKDGAIKSNEVAITVTAPAVPEEDKELSEAFDVTETPATTYVESTVTGLTDNATIQAKKNSDGTFTLTAPETKGDAQFLYWAKGMSRNKKIVSFSNVLSDYMPEENGKNYLIAVYEDVVSETAEYYNANGQRIATGEAPEYPAMAGYGKATGWARFGKTNIYVAEYGNKTQPDNVTVTVNGKAETVPYGTKITCAADDAKANFKCWKKSGINGKEEIVSAAKTYTFNAWETCTITAVYEDYNYTGEKAKIVVDTFSVGNDTAVMAEFIGFDNAVEKGIMYNGTKIAMTKPGNQFTVMADAAGTFIGYAIIGNAIDGYTLVTDGNVTVSK